MYAQPAAWDVLIRKLGYLASQDPAINQLVPDLAGLYHRVLKRLEAEPLTITVTNARTKQPVEIRVGKIGLQWIVFFSMNDARNFSRLPALIYTIDQSDYSLLKPRIESLYNEFTGRSPMANATNCSQGWSTERVARVRKQTAGAMFSNINLEWRDEICRSVSTRNSGAAETRLSSNIPALFISGTLDAVTPPFQAEDVRWGFPNSTHLIIENGGHETLPSQDVQSVVLDFFKGIEVTRRSVVFPKPKFLSIQDARSSPATRR